METKKPSRFYKEHNFVINLEQVTIIDCRLTDLIVKTIDGNCHSFESQEKFMQAWYAFHGETWEGW